MFKFSIYSVYLFVLCFFVLLSDISRQVKENRYYVFILRGHVVVRMMFYEKNLLKMCFLLIPIALYV